MRRLINSTRTLLALLLLYIGGVTGVSAQTEQTATFDFSSATTLGELGLPTTSGSEVGTATYTVDGVTMVNADGVTAATTSKVWGSGTSMYLRIYYGGGALTFSVAEGYITSIVCTFASTSSSNNAKKVSADSGTWEATTSSTGTWTPSTDAATSTTSVKLTTTGTSGHARYQSVVVTYVSTGLPSAGLAFSTTAYTVPQGTTSIDEPTLTFAENFDGTVTYASNNEDVATVNSSTGEVTLAGGTGTAKITASSEETSNFAAGSASYTIAVLPVYENLAALRAAITATSADFYVTLTNAVVTWVNGSTAYLEDATAGIVYYKSGQSLTQGDVLNGTVKVSGLFYNNQFDELTDIDGATITTGGTIPVTEVTIAELIADVDKYESRRVKIVGAEVTSALSGSSATLTQNGSDLSVYCTLSLENLQTEGLIIDAIGYPYTYNNAASFRVFENPTLNEDAKTPSGLAFSAETATANLGESFTAPTLTYNTDATITYSSSDPTVATVDASTGAVTILAAGTTVITATSPESDTYLAGEASYTLTVIDPNKVYVYKKVTSQDDIFDGGIYLVVDVNGEYAMGELSSNSNYRAQVALTSKISDDVITLTSTNESDAPYEVTLEAVAGSENTYGFLLENGSYLAKTSSGNNLNESTSGPGSADASKWTVTYESESDEVSIRNVDANTYRIRYNAGSDRYSCYTSTQRAVTLYSRVGEITIGTEEGYGTYYTDTPFKMPAGLKGTTVTGVSDGKLTTAWGYAEGAEVPANTALLLYGTKGSYTYAILGKDVTAAEGTNYLRGSVEAEATTGGSVYYKLTYNSTEGEKVLGFYWGAEDGGAFTNAAHKAYLALPTSLAAQFKGFAFGEDTATGISAVEQDSNEAAAIYTIGGVRLNSSLKALPKGVYIVNGKKVIK